MGSEPRRIEAAYRLGILAASTGSNHSGLRVSHFSVSHAVPRTKLRNLGVAQRPSKLLRTRSRVEQRGPDAQRSNRPLLLFDVDCTIGMLS